MEKAKLGVQEIIGEKRDTILELAEKRSAFNVRVFGSVARGEATPQSDVDFLVEFKPGASLWDMVGLWQDLTELLEREVDLSTDKTLKKWIKPNALKDAVTL